MNPRTHAISLYHVKATRRSIQQQKLPLPVNPFGIVETAEYRS